MGLDAMIENNVRKICEYVTGTHIFSIRDNNDSSEENSARRQNCAISQGSAWHVIQLEFAQFLWGRECGQHEILTEKYVSIYRGEKFQAARAPIQNYTIVRDSLDQDSSMQFFSWL